MANINISADLGADGFIKSTKNMEKALEDVSDELEDVAKSGDNSLEKLSDKLKQARKDAQNAGDGIEKGLKDGTRKGVDGAEEGLDEFKRESNSTAKESAASFDGSAESIVDSFQEIAANAFAGFGPAGTLAGLALAAGIGLGMKSIEDAATASEEFKTKVGELTDAFIESGKTGALSLDQVVDAYKELATATDDTEINLRDIKKAADTSANSFEDLADALAGNTENLDKLIESEEERLKVLQNQANYDPITQAQEEIALEEQRVDAQEKLIEKLKETQKLTGEAAESEKLYLELGIPALEARAQMQSTINDFYDEGASNVDDFYNTETKLFDTTAYIASMQTREKAITDYTSTLASSDLSNEAKSHLDSLGVEAASKMLSGYTASTPEVKKELNRIWTEAGKESSGVAKEEVDKAFKTPTEAKIQAKLDEESRQEVQRALNKLGAEAAVTIKVKAVDQFGNVLK